MNLSSFNLVYDVVLPLRIREIYLGKPIHDERYPLTVEQLAEKIAANPYGLTVDMRKKENFISLEIERNVPFISNGFKTSFIGELLTSYGGSRLLGKLVYRKLAKIFVTMWILATVGLPINSGDILMLPLIFVISTNVLRFGLILTSIANQEGEFLIDSLLGDLREYR